MQNDDNMIRVKQFLPFDALKGFKEALLKQERESKERINLSEDDCYKLNEIFFRLKKNMEVKIIYYDIDSYKVICGRIKKIDLINRKLFLSELGIKLDDLIDIQIILEKKDDE